MTHLYNPTDDERQRVKDHIAKNSGFTPSGQPKPGRDNLDVLYPRGMKDFAKHAKVNVRQLSRILNGGGTKRSTWKRIMSQLYVSEEEYAEELMQQLARIRGIAPELIQIGITMAERAQATVNVEKS